MRELENIVARLVVTCRSAVADVEDLPPEIGAGPVFAASPRRERRRRVVDDLYRRLVEDRESFWTAVYPLYMRRDITRSTVQGLVRKALQEACGSYKIVVRLFNMEWRDYKKFLNFLRKHGCQVPFKEYR